MPIFAKKFSFFCHLVVLDVPQSPYLDCSPTSNYGIGSNWPYQLVFDTLYHSLEVNGGSRDPFWWLIGPKISFLGHLVVLDCLQSLLFHCWATSYVDIGLKWPYKSDYDTQYQRQGVTGAPFMADFTKNLIFWSFCWPRWTSIRSFGLLINFYVGIDSHWPYQPVFDSWYHQPRVTCWSPGPFWWPIWPKDSFLSHLVILHGLQSLNLDCWPTSDVGIGSHWPYQPIFDTWYHTSGVIHGSQEPFLWSIWQKS